MDRESGSDSPVATIEGRGRETGDRSNAGRTSLPPAFSSQWAEWSSCAFSLYSLSFGRISSAANLGMAEQLLLDSGRLAGGLAGVAAAAAVADVHAAGDVVVVRRLSLRLLLMLLLLLLMLKLVKQYQWMFSCNTGRRIRL